MYKIKKWLFDKKWRKSNPDNFTMPARIFDANRVKIGKGTYGKIDVLINSKDNSSLIIKNYCSIAEEVVFVLAVEHDARNISTYPYKVKCLGVDREAFSKGDIIIDDDVWIGHRAMILSGVHIGQGAIIGTGAVVTKDIPPYAVVGGVPAKIIKYRFSEDLIEKLLHVDFSKFTDEFIKNHINDFYSSLEKESDLTWLPMKE